MPASVLEVLITGDATQLKLAFTQATAATKEYQAATVSSSAATKEASATATAFGNASSKAFTYAKLGALAFAAISVKAAIDFNREFTLIAAVTNTAADQIDSLKSTVLDLSHETAVAPTDLAHALYFLASAGLTATQQMQALDATAHGVAVGLGTAGDLARITANALNAFGDQGLTATQVMDTLTAAIREGTAEPDEFAGALGRVLPIADNAGISFQAVAASLATMSNAGLDVNEGVTALRAILQSLVAPTAQTTSAFQTMGLSVTDVVASMQGQGLIATLRLVSDRAKQVTNSTGEYNQLMRHAIPNIRGLAGALNLTGQDAAKVDEIFKAVSNSTGDLAKAFQTTAQSDAFKLSQAINDIKIAGMDLATDVLPILADGLGVVARNAKVLLAGLLAYGAAKFVAPLLRDIAAANTTLAASETAAAEAGGAKLLTGLNFGAGLAQFGSIGASSSVAAHQLAVEAGSASTALTSLNSASAGAVGGIARFGNTIAEKGLPQIFALVQGLIDAKNEIDAFKTEGISGALQSVAASGSASVFGNVPVVGSAIKAFQSAMGQSDAQKHFADGITAVNAALADAAKTAPEKTAIIDSALASIGGSLSTDNIDEYVTAVQGQLDAEAQQKAQADATAAANLELAKQTQAAAESTKSWQKTTAEMTDHLSGLNRIGIDTTDFMKQLESDLASSDDQAKTFSDAIDKVSEAWMNFKSSAQTALNFAPQALADLSSAAQQAQDQLASMTDTSSTSATELAQLRDTANLTAGDILQAFQQSAAKTKSFSQDLLELAHVGGAAGKDLAASLLQSGDVLSAQVIADAPAKIQGQIVHAFGKSESAADTFSTKLTNAIVGPLHTIEDLLVQLAKKAFGVDLHYNDHGAQHQVDTLTHGIEGLTNTKHEINVIVHTKGGSPMPDEALKKHLFDPMKTAGFKRVGDTYTLPLEVAAHTTAEGPTGGGAGMAHLGALLAVEKDSRAFLKEISKAVKGGDGNGVHGHLGGTGGGGTGSGGGGGGGGGGVTLSDSLTASVDKIVGTINKFATPKEAKGVVERVAHAGRDTAFIRESIQQVSKELGKTAAERYGKALRDLDEATRDSEKRRNAALQESLDAIEAIRQAHQAKMDARRTKQALGFEMKNVPGLPRGHTNIDPNAHALGGPGHHPRALTVVMDRRHYADSLSQEVSYGRGY